MLSQAKHLLHENFIMFEWKLSLIKVLFFILIPVIFPKDIPLLVGDFGIDFIVGRKYLKCTTDSMSFNSLEALYSTCGLHVALFTNSWNNFDYLVYLLFKIRPVSKWWASFLIITSVLKSKTLYTCVFVAFLPVEHMNLGWSYLLKMFKKVAS